MISCFEGLSFFELGSDFVWGRGVYCGCRPKNRVLTVKEIGHKHMISPTFREHMRDSNSLKMSPY